MIKCIETGFIILITEKIFGVSCPATNAVEPICESCLKNIPEEVKRKGMGMMCEQGERGIDIYLATAEATEEGYAPSSFAPGKFFFSLSEADAQRFLPNTFNKLPKPPQKKKRVA